MMSTLTLSESVLCLVCNKVTYDNAVNIYSGLVKRSGTIYDQISEIVGIKAVSEARELSDVVCPICLKLLLNINNVESELKNFKIQFKILFQSGILSRKASTVNCVEYSGIKYESPMNEVISTGRSDDKIFVDCDLDERNLRTSLLKVGKDCIYDVNIDVGCIKESFHTEQASFEGKESISLEESENTITNGKSCDIIQVSQENGDELSKEFTHALYLVKESIEKHEVECSVTDSDKGSDFKSVELTNVQGNFSELPASPIATDDDLEANLSFDFENFETRLCSGDGNEEIKETSNVEAKKTKRKCNKAGKSGKRRKLQKGRKASSIAKDCDKTKDCSGVEDGHQICRQDENRRKSCDLCKDKYCKICNQVLASVSELIEHRGIVHGDVYKYVCDKCPNVRYRHLSKLTQHLKLRHKVHVHQCPGCDVEEKSQESLDQHIINKHPESRFFECKFCSKAFRTYRYLHRVHIKRCHIGLPIKYFCDKCSKGFVDKSSLDNHKYTHSEVKNFTCNFCGATFLTPYSRKVHLNIHTQEKKYTCQTCGVSFLRLCNLIGHKKRAHLSKEKRYVCEICGTLLHTNKDLVKHQDICHNDGENLESNKCYLSPSNKKNVKTHHTEHFQDKPFTCHCGKAYMTKSRLQHHCKVVHKNVPSQNFTIANGVVAEEAKADDKDNEENMVVITVKECNPQTLYTVQAAPSHEIYISGIPVSQVDGNGISKTLTTTQNVEIPLLHSPFGAVEADKISLSAPILFTSLTTNPTVNIHHTSEAEMQEIPTSKLEPIVTEITGGVHEDFTYHSGSLSASVNSDNQDSIQVLRDRTREPQTADTLTTELLEIPDIHASNPNGVPVTYITAWP